MLGEALAVLPADAWTSYGDLAELIGTAPISVGEYVAEHPVTNAHHVLQSDGRINDNFRRLDRGRTDDPRILLESEGVVFDGEGRADPAQRVTVALFRDLLGIASGEDIRRAWLVRGTNVRGENLVGDWLSRGYCSLPAAKLRRRGT